MPTSTTEKKLHKIWRKVNHLHQFLFSPIGLDCCQVLHLRTIDVTESFFDLGGHSLAATYMLEMVYEQLNVELRVHELFQFPSIVELAKVILITAIQRFLLTLKIH